MGMNPSIHFLPNSHRQIFFAFSKTLLPLSHSAYNTNRCSHMPMTQRDGETVCWRNKSTSRWIASQRKPWWQPIAQASVLKVLSQMSRSESPWGRERWRVPWGLSWRNSGAIPLLKGFFHDKETISSAHFDSVWWLGYKRAISKYPKTFCTFITKQASGRCGCNSKLSLWEENIINKCPQCGCNNVNSKHLTRCTDPGCVLQLHNSIEAIMDVLNEANVTLELADVIETYLLNQGHQTMEDCIKLNSKYVHLSTDINNLGWDCFVEGWLPYSLITVIKPMFNWYKPRGSIEIWGTKFIKSLISLTHKQWLYRKCDMHYISNRLTSRQHNELTSKIKELMKTKR